MIDLLLEPFTYEFMRRALVIALLIGAACAIFSCFLVLKGWSLMGDAVSHAVLPGLALAYMVGIPLAVGAFISGLICAISTGYIKIRTPLKEDAVMGIVFTAMFSLGLVMISKVQSDIHLMHVLFGNILGVSSRDILETALIALPVMALLLAKRRDLMLFCFDPEQCKTLGLPTGLYHYGLLIALALTIVVAIKAAGIILVIAMLITPGAIGLLMTKRFDSMIGVAMGVSLFSALLGTYLSYFIDVATAPLIIVTQAALFIVALIISPKSSLFSSAAQEQNL